MRAGLKPASRIAWEPPREHCQRSGTRCVTTVPRISAMPVSRDAALNRIRLRHLQCFLAVAEARNLRRAAEALAISQPAVTKTLNELEEILGVRLFERGRGGARPTPEAE